MDKLKVALVQSAVIQHDYAKNLEYYTHKLEELKDEDVQLVILPEFFPTGNTLESILLKTGIESSSLVHKWLTVQSKRLNLIIAGAYLSLENRQVFNKFVIQDPNGKISFHYKRFCPVVEAIYYQVGSIEDNIVDTSIGKIGLITCIEMLYPEVMKMNFEDCTLILIAFAIPNQFGLKAVIRRLTKVPLQLAKKNGVPVMLCSMGGEFSSEGSPFLPFKMKSMYAGNSGIYFPDGSVIGPISSEKEGILIAEISTLKNNYRKDSRIYVKTGIPIHVRFLNWIFKKKASKIYNNNLNKFLNDLEGSR